MRLIDADALIEQMKADAEQMVEPVFKMATYAAINDVKHQPTIEERKKGHWIGKGDHAVGIDSNGYVDWSAWCSECGEWLTASDEYAVRGWFCPNCGAEMEGGRE